MDISSLLTLLLISFISMSEAIKCKCTKESDTVKCEGGTCEMEGGSCLMLDHPKLGIHFTCHTRTLQDGSCRSKTSKTNSSVRICGCHSEDFCNYSIWPNGSASEGSRPKSDEDVNRVSSSSFLISIPLILSLRFL
ncbi:hypothetical protein PRIPAC_92611 [Pristionchus pacificus]|uniref:Uncharacterized protein n=1 Tax=Pristionchus pacificus TaxID=54126 RepID=A0A2A6B483_PRIPA|nr:hypothetical protein PRIPAC_92611 [Pristionchus pacificus]|eukprot:PDM60689.1 hypothetical protein PRIPAC_53958 [Pristionchus pacificus]